MTGWEIAYLLLGLWLGATTGFLLCAILTVGANSDEKEGNDDLQVC